jgi:hypothetical protein
VKYEQLEQLSEIFGLDLCLPSIRMPLTVLNDEDSDGLLHYIIRESHQDYASITRVYDFMGRSMKKRTTLLTSPHSRKGYGSKRAARGKLYFKDNQLSRIKVTYRTTRLYPNAIDPDDVSVARAEDQFFVDGKNLASYIYDEIPSSPQFILYSLGSPENGVLWHGIGAFGASKLVQSYTSTRLACAQGLMFNDLNTKYGRTVQPSLQLNLDPKHMWGHPTHHNIDASIGTVESLHDLVKMGMWVQCLSFAPRL